MPSYHTVSPLLIHICLDSTTTATTATEAPTDENTIGDYTGAYAIAGFAIGGIGIGINAFLIATWWWTLNWCPGRIGQDPDNLYIWPQCCYHPQTQTPSGDLWGCLLKYTGKG